MPKGPKGEKRPADVIGNAVKVMRIAVGEDYEVLNKRTVRRDALVGSNGGTERASKLTPERRTEIAKKAAKVRWKAPSDV